MAPKPLGEKASTLRASSQEPGASLSSFVQVGALPNGAPLYRLRSGSCQLDALKETTSHRDERGEVPVGHDVFHLYCAKCGKKHRVVMRCGDRLCVYCKRKDFHRLYFGYRESVAVMKYPKLVTLTLRNVPVLNREVIRRLRRAWVKLMRRRFWKSKVRGGLYVIEITNRGRGWHVHIHALVDAEYLDARKLSEDWRKVTGDSFIVDVRRAEGVREGLRYILKYLTKGSELTEEQKQTVREATKGVRLVQPFGSLYAELVCVSEGWSCSECGSHEFLTWEFDLRGAFNQFRDGKGVG